MENFERQDLQKGDELHFRDGDVEIFAHINYMGQMITNKSILTRIGEDLTHDHNNDYDIIKVVRPEKVMFERKEIPEYTMSEIVEIAREKLGHDFKIKN